MNVLTAGTYTLTTSVAGISAATFDVSSNTAGGSVTLASFTAPSTGNWQTFAPVSQNITLSAGQQTLRFTATNSSQYNLGAIQLVRQIAPVAVAPAAPVVPPAGPRPVVGAVMVAS